MRSIGKTLALAKVAVSAIKAVDVAVRQYENGVMITLERP